MINMIKCYEKRYIYKYQFYCTGASFDGPEAVWWHVAPGTRPQEVARRQGRRLAPVSVASSLPRVAPTQPLINKSIMFHFFFSIFPLLLVYNIHI